MMQVVIILALVSLALAIPQSGRPVQIGHPSFVNFGRIVGGEEAGENEFPWQVTLQALDTTTGQWFHWCGASIYSERHIITAAHCVINQNVADLQVIAGEHDLFVSTGNEQVRAVESFVFNPDFNSSVFDNDIALVTLAEPFIFNLRVQPIRIAESSFEPSGKCVNTGWGNTMGDGSVNNPNKLQKVELDIVTRDECADIYSGINGITSGMICAAVQGGGKGACNGDNGGPLICLDESNRGYLAGIVSWGMTPCALDGYPSVYANVAAYRSFVENVVNAVK